MLDGTGPEMAQEPPLPLGSPPIVAFDFDGTLTIRDSFTEFLRWRAGPARFALGLLRLIPAGIAYLFHRDRGRIKAAAVHEFLQGAPRKTLIADARRFAEERGPALLRPDALAEWRRWRGQGAVQIIVTAAPEVVVAPFAANLGADGLIATKLAYDAQDRADGGLMTPNCRGPEKVERLKQAFGPDVRLKAAYGDTDGDREMLQIAETTGYRVFKARPPAG
jgi:phosphatidylglycerophosphatase C